MSDASPQLETDVQAFVKKYDVCWERAPLHEVVKGHGVEPTGYSLSLFGRFDGAAQDDDEALARDLYERLRTLADEALRSVPADVVIEAQPPGRTILPVGPGYVIEVELALVATPTHPDHQQPPADVRRHIAALEARLLAMGVRKRA